MTPQVCRFCSEVTAGYATTNFRGTELRWIICHACGFISQGPYSNDVEQAKNYGNFVILDEEFRDWHNWESLLKSCEYNAQIMDADRDKYPARRYLEVGAFSGFLMEQMRRRGWNVRGQELTAHGCAEGAAHGLQIDCCSVLEYEPGSEFDVISAREFIEHLWDFRGLIERCYRWQAPGGKLWIQTPVTDGGLKFERQLSFQPDHVSLMSLKNLDSALRAVGYTPVLLENRDGCGIVAAVKE